MTRPTCDAISTVTEGAELHGAEGKVGKEVEQHEQVIIDKVLAVISVSHHRGCVGAW